MGLSRPPRALHDPNDGRAPAPGGVGRRRPAGDRLAATRRRPGDRRGRRHRLRPGQRVLQRRSRHARRCRQRRRPTCWSSGGSRRCWRSATPSTTAARCRTSSGLRPELGAREADHPPGRRQPRVRHLERRGLLRLLQRRRAPTARPGERDKGYYSYDVGAWHLIALNSSATRSHDEARCNGCAPGSPQEHWLRADLAAHRTACTLAYWHQPAASTRATAATRTVVAAVLGRALRGGCRRRAERRRPRLRALRAAGPERAIATRRAASASSWSAPAARASSGSRHRGPNSEARDDLTFGVLKLTLRPGEAPLGVRPRTAPEPSRTPARPPAAEPSPPRATHFRDAPRR